MKSTKYSALHFDNSLWLFTFMILNISFVFIFRSISERHSKLWSSGPAEDSNRIIFWRNAATIQQLKISWKSAENSWKSAENNILKPFYYSTTMKKLWAFASNFLCFFIILIPAIFIRNCGSKIPKISKTSILNEGSLLLTIFFSTQKNLV